MNKIYCECETRLAILETISDDIYIVERCPNCAPEWVSVKDMFPVRGELVLVCWENNINWKNRVHFAMYNDDNGTWWVQPYGVSEPLQPSVNPTHWKPRPKAKGVA